jgi:type II secretory pathway pseudopilin PulG
MKIKDKGFTIIELAWIIIFIGIIAAIAIPKFTSLHKNAKNAADEKTISTIKTVINLLYMKNKIEGKDEYPTGAEVADVLANLDMKSDFEPHRWCYKDYGDTVVFYCDHSNSYTAEGRRWWTYYRVDKDGHHAGEVVEGSEKH